jgi:hypothetical protein
MRSAEIGQKLRRSSEFLPQPVVVERSDACEIRALQRFMVNLIDLH